MHISFFKVVSQDTVTYRPSKTQEGKEIVVCGVRLREFGTKNSDEFLCTLYGNAALAKFYPDDVVVAALRFKVRESGEKKFQDIVVTDIYKLNNSF